MNFIVQECEQQIIMQGISFLLNRIIKDFQAVLVTLYMYSLSKFYIEIYDICHLAFLNNRSQKWATDQNQLILSAAFHVLGVL